MTNKSAIILLVILGMFAAADVVFGWGLSVFLGRRLLDLIDLIAIWR